MNKIDLDLLNNLYKNKYINQRFFSNLMSCSLGAVNKSLKSLLENGYIDKNKNLTKKAIDFIEENKPKSAVILAAGFGIRIVPISLETPKALLKVRGEILIERIIKQLREKNIEKIYIVVGFMKEKFEYLIDKFNVELVINTDYGIKNNLFSLSLVLDKLDNSYIIPCDIFCKYNPFNDIETYSWYMVTEEFCENSSVRLNNRKNCLVNIKNDEIGNKMIGISYLCKNDIDFFKERVNLILSNYSFNVFFWESSLVFKDKFFVYPKIVNKDDYFEISTYEDLRNFDKDSDNLKTNELKIICDVFKINFNDIKNINVLKKGMTNRSFLFTIKDIRYIMRIPGDGTDELIDRKAEAKVYNLLKNKNICDELVYINPENGYKITKFIENSKSCDDKNIIDLKSCINKLKELHFSNLKVDYEFDIFERINFYKSLWKNKNSIYKDYEETYSKIFSLKDFIKKNEKDKCLVHIDANCDNFLILDDGSVRLIDWEYASMADPDIDIAMFCLYSLYSKDEVDNLINIYFDGKVEENIRIKIYAYIACCGLLWSNWCEYKLNFGIEFGEYAIKQYRFAKEYYKIVENLLGD